MNPKQLNYKMPPEWTKHTRTFISWPVKASMCYPENYEEVCQGYTEIIKAIAEFEPITVVANSEDFKKLSCLFQNERIEILEIEHNDAWLRDNGPTFLIRDDGDRAGVNWRFNAWGGKYAPWDLDDQVASEILKHVKLKGFDAPLVMEGGSFHVDGEGTLLTTEECLLNPNRNPNMSREQIEAVLGDFLDIQKVVWLKKGLDGDETDGHVDNIACFAAPGKILLQVCDDPTDENYAITQENLAILKRETDALGRRFEIIPIHQPPKLCDPLTKGRLTLSYLNFYFVNGGIVLPVFGGKAKEFDGLAVQVLSQTFPRRRIRTVNGMGIIREGGNVHCTTQQMPAGRD
ncbi:agmatine deiminase family protein [Desulfosporosinus sp.]|uniref:agmatine deiminase family protein n=1 Tax=Desulfosporosinus sp. TaxID=157907 RepID=UPI000E95ACB9|nr:agmatine deiminase family protein [Desulfosporosinus sp.]MBC2723169.1 agmatine deiminase family protein [Desulfosporosinus sp.]MBC2726533.1 agmatine deiminase family protein [Desulfosporosinus sp.]HBV87435.1 agmatine deiminase [Desulfosporosinus sp.]